MPTRSQALEIIQTQALSQIADLYDVEPNDLRLYPDYDGCQNIVFFYDKGSAHRVLRVSFRDDRPPEQILAELDFVRYLHDNGVHVSPPVESRTGRYMEVISSDSQKFVAVSFERAPGHRLPDQGYRYRDGASIDEYYFNCGRLLGQMHRLARDYAPHSPARTRPRLVDTLTYRIASYLPPSESKVRERFQSLLAEVTTFPVDSDAYGLIHADFGDGNYCVDDTNGNITIFDFDDSAYCWFMYDLADAWRSGMGWTMAEADPRKRRAFMDKFFDTVLKGYASEHTLTDTWLKRLPTFLKLIEMEAFLSEARDVSINGSEDVDDGAIAYQRKCIEEDIPFLGFFDGVYFPEHPFELFDRE